jgi:hypothetical protein
VVIATEWQEFCALDFRRLKRIMKQATMVDLRNVYRPDDMAKVKFRYVGVGGVGVTKVRKRAGDVRRRLALVAKAPVLQVETAEAL